MMPRGPASGNVKGSEAIPRAGFGAASSVLILEQVFSNHCAVAIDHCPTPMKPSSEPDALTGRRLRALRLRAHLSMRELARRSKVAVSYISNVESGKVSATLATLRKLLIALDSDIGPFFAEDQSPPEGWVFRRQHMQTTSDSGRSYTFVLPARPDIGLIMLDEELFAGENPGFESLSGDLSGYVLAGELELELQGERRQILQAGDAFCIPAGRAARGCCVRFTSVRLVTVQVLERGAGPRANPRHRGSSKDLPPKAASVPKSADGENSARRHAMHK
jgi:transcriptional regulator with XRE-family HTH domain